MATSSREPQITTRVIYSGHVQGVGFRFTTREIAHSHPVTGFVRNLPNGSVELVARGTTDSVREFLDAIATRFRRNITNAEEAILTTPEEFDSFDIRH